MPVNSDLHYLLAGLNVNNDGIQHAVKRAELSEGVNTILQSYSEEYPAFFSEDPKHAFCNEPTYQLHEEAEISSWKECLSAKQLGEVEAFCVKHQLKM